MWIFIFFANVTTEKKQWKYFIPPVEIQSSELTLFEKCCLKNRGIPYQGASPPTHKAVSRGRSSEQGVVAMLHHRRQISSGELAFHFRGAGHKSYIKCSEARGNYSNSHRRSSAEKVLLLRITTMIAHGHNWTGPPQKRCLEPHGVTQNVNLPSFTQ